MEKNWFIFKGDHHLGPFSSEDLVRMLRNEKVTKEDLIWKEGEADWLPLFQHPALRGFFSKPKKALVVKKVQPVIIKEPVKEFIEEDTMPPPLPPLPELVEFEEETLAAVEDFPPALPPLPIEEVVIEQKIAPKRLIFDEYTLTDEELAQADGAVANKEYVIPNGIWEEAPSWQKTMMISSLVIGLLMSLHFFNWSGSDSEVSKFSGIARSVKKEMHKIVESSQSKLTAKLALSNTGNEIWLALNHLEDAIIYLSLKSVRGRTIGKDRGPIELRSVGELYKGGAKFRKIELLSGESIAEGEYNAHIVGYATGWKSRLAAYLKSVSIFKGLSFVNNFMPQFNINLPFLYSVKSKSEFIKILNTSKFKKKKDESKPFEVLILSHHTFSSILMKIKKLYKSTLDQMSKGKDINLFERRYGLEIEPSLRSLLLDSNRKHIALINENKQRSEDYLKLVEEGKEIGILVSDMVTRTRKYGKLNKRKRKKLIKIFEPQIQEILTISKKDSLRLESEMKRLLIE